ncbi:MAG: molecular chaperone HtpG [Clostridia bacterium]|nr:molecular chaperone HtpG [Clostridia bacterium]
MAKKQFQAESKRLLDLMINSIYTHQEIFLREIISNASDAIDKLAYLALTDENVGLNRSDFAIELSVDEANRSIMVRDNGIGMNQEEMEKNLGTICRSGSLQFKQEMDKGKDADVDIIGQFGVGFYSAFMVADTVTVISKKYGSDEAFMWTSSGADGYTIAKCTKKNVGTDVIMKLKADTDDEKYSRFLQSWELQNLIHKYSDYIRYPIRMEVEKTRIKEGTADSEKPEYESYKEVETLNSMVPLWQKAKKDVTEEEYNEFYKEHFFDFEDPVAVIHTSVEGAVSYKALLYIPAKAPYDFYTKEFKKGLQLYSSGVMIMENCADLLPDCFRFVRGVVDSQDLSLNISREMLQHDRQLKFIAQNLEKKIKAELQKLMENDREKYEKFYAGFATQLKYGTLNDYGAKKETMQDLLLYWSSKEEKLVSFKDYTAAMPEEQKYIYYASGETRERPAQLPQMETLKAKGYDVLFMTEEVDGFIPQTLMKYGEKEFRSVTQEDLGLASDEEKKSAEEKTEKAKQTIDFIKETLGERVKEVRLSSNLGSHPVCMVPAEGMTFEMEKYFKRLNPDADMKANRVLELNPDHAVFGKLQIAVAQDQDKAAKLVKILHAQALLMADLPIENAAEYTDLICELL